MNARARSPRNERGFTLVLFALTLVSMLVFAAFAVDLGALYNHRRQDQNAADAAALAAAHLLGGDEEQIANDAKAFAHDTLGLALTDDEWNSCVGDPGALANPATGDPDSCITYSLRRVRVRVPDQQYETTFGSVVGADQFRHGAFAIGALIPEGYGGVLPYAVTGVSAEGGFGCLQTNSNGQASSWCGSSSGNFGFLDFSHYGEPDLGTTKSCGSGDINVRLRNNTAMGVDHDLSLAGEEYPIGTTVIDTTACASLTPAPNAANTQTGNQADDITDGLLRLSSFPDGGAARLRRVDNHLFGSGGDEATVFGLSNVDDNSLWRFIPDDYGPTETTDADIPRSCERDQFVTDSGNYYAAGVDNPNVPDDVEAFLHSPGLAQPRDRVLGLLARCFTHYRGGVWDGAPVGSLASPEARPSGDCAATQCTGIVFALNSTDTDQPDLFDIQYTPRFGYVPQISDFPSGTSQPRTFIRFRPIYIYRLLLESGGSTYIADPGVTPAAPTADPGGTWRVGETSVFVFPDGMLPGRLASQDAPFEIGVNRFIRLTR